MTDDATLPAPLVPPDVDLRDYDFMPLDVRRYRDSGLVSTKDPEQVVAATMLWCASWHQMPASSLPVDDLELSPLAGYGRGVKDFRRVKQGALHRFVLCSDLRYYHPVVAEKAAEGWNGKLDEQHKRACDRMRKLNVERKERGEDPLPMPARGDRLKRFGTIDMPFWRYTDPSGNPKELPARSNGVPAELPDDSNGKRGASTRKSRLKGEGEGEGQGKGQAPVPPPSATEPLAEPLAGGGRKTTPPPAEKREGRTRETAATYAVAYEQRYGVRPTFNRTVNGQLAAFVDRIGVDEAPAVAAFFVRSNKGLYVSAKHATNLLVRDAEALRTEWATQGRKTPDDDLAALSPAGRQTAEAARRWIEDEEAKERDGAARP